MGFLGKLGGALTGAAGGALTGAMGGGGKAAGGGVSGGVRKGSTDRMGPGRNESYGGQDMGGTRNPMGMTARSMGEPTAKTYTGRAMGRKATAVRPFSSTRRMSGRR